jgi:hypothetical protein
VKHKAVKPYYSRRRGRPARYVCVELIREMHLQGHSFREIAHVTGIGYGTVRRAFAGRAPAGAAVPLNMVLPPALRFAVNGQKSALLREMAAAG